MHDDPVPPALHRIPYAIFPLQCPHGICSNVNIDRPLRPRTPRIRLRSSPSSVLTALFLPTSQSTAPRSPGTAVLFTVLRDLFSLVVCMSSPLRISPLHCWAGISSRRPSLPHSVLFLSRPSSSSSWELRFPSPTTASTACGTWYGTLVGH